MLKVTNTITNLIGEDRDVVAMRDRIKKRSFETQHTTVSRGFRPYLVRGNGTGHERNRAGVTQNGFRQSISG